MVDLIAIAALIAVLGAAVVYIRREKKKGHACVGCPHAAQCAKAKKNGCCGG